jgi:hypothetical protein
MTTLSSLLPPGGVISNTGAATLSNKTIAGDLKFADSDASNYVALQAAATVPANVTWTLPAADGTNGQVLSTNGSGTLSWATASGGGGGNKIEQGDSKVEVTDTGSNGTATFTMDGTVRAKVNQYGLGLGTETPSSGMGIKFPVTQSASSDANTLDDYEEGTFTPDLKFGGNAVSLTYSSRAGRYTKIGRCVTVSFVFVLSNKGSSSGFATVSLPFSSDEYGQPNQPGYPGGLAFYGGMTNATKAGFIVGNIGAAGYVTAGTATTDSGNYATEANFNNNTTFAMTVTYNTST